MLELLLQLQMSVLVQQQLQVVLQVVLEEEHPREMHRIRFDPGEGQGGLEGEVPKVMGVLPVVGGRSMEVEDRGDMV